MAWIRDYSIGTDNDGTATTITPDTMPTHETDDLLLMFCGKRNTGGNFTITTPASGWTSINDSQGGNVTTGTFYKVATGSSETTPIATNSDADEVYCVVVVVANVDTATPIDTSASQVEGFGYTGSHTLTTAGTTSANDTLNFYLHIADGANTRFPVQESGLMMMDYIRSPYTESSLTWTYQNASGSMFNPTYKMSDSATGQIQAVAINSNTTTAEEAPRVDIDSPPTEAIHPLRGSVATGSFGGGNVDPSTDLSGGVGPTTETFNYKALQGDSGEGVDAFAQALSILSTGSSTSYNGLWGAIWDLSVANYDITGQNLTVSVGTLDGGRVAAVDSVANGGSIFGIRTDNGAGGNIYRFWNVGASNSQPNLFYKYTIVIDPSDTTYQWGADIGSGTIDLANITGLFIGCKKVGNVQLRSTFAECHGLNPVPIIGGNNNAPCELLTFVDAIKAPRIKTIINQSGASQSQIYSLQQLQVGNGSTPVYFNQDTANLEFATTTTGNNLQWSVGDNGAGITFYAVSGDTVTFTNSTISGGTVWDFAIHASSTSAATWDFSGLNIINADVVLRDVFTAASGMSFIDCPTFTGNSADLSGGCTFDGTEVTVTSEAEFNDFHNCAFKNNNYSITITGNHGGDTWTATGMTVEGGTGSYDIQYTGTGTLTIEAAVGSGWTQVRSEATVGTLTIDAPSTSFTVNSSEASSDIKIFTTATQTILSSATGTTDTYIYTGTPTFDWTVMKAGFLPQRGTGVLMAGASVTVEVTLVADPVYDSGHGLTYTTDASWSRSNNELTVPTWGPTARNVYSLMIDSFISQSSLDNTAYNISMNGPNSMFLIEDAEGATDASVENMTAGGVRYLSSADAVTAEWVGIQSIGTVTGFQGEFQQQDGSGTTDARATGVFDEVVKVYKTGAGAFDYRSHLVLKFQPNTYREARVDVLDTYGVATLEPTHYIVAMEPVDIGLTAGDPAISITIVDHTGAPLVVGGKSFDYEIQDNGANDGNAMLREVNYNLSQDGTYQGKDAFNWPEMILLSGTSYETIYGAVEGISGLHGVYVSRSAADHPSFTRFQSNDGTYYTVPITANASIPTIVAGSRLRVYNETTATETYNGVPGTSYSDSYTEGTTYTSGDVVTIYLTQTSGTTAQLSLTATAIASSSGWTIIASQESDDVYNQYGLNGSTITKFSADYVNDEVDLTVASNFSGEELYAWWVYNLTTSQGISDFYGGFTAEDAANLRINNSVVNMYQDNTTTSNVYQTDNIRIYRADGAYPVKNPTSGGGGIDVVWRDKVYIAVTGSGVTSQDKTDIKNLVFDEVVEGSETFKQQVRLMRAEAAGKLAVSGTTVTIRDAGDTKDRITATVDSNGQRTSVTTDAS